MLKKVCSKIFGVCALLGFVVMLGTAGASDLDTLSFEKIVIQSALGLVLMVVGFIGLRLSDCKYIR